MDHLFISYGHADATDFAKRLKADLEAAGYAVRWDEQDIQAGHLWDVRIEQMIRQSTTLLAVLTPAATREDSVCRDEVTFALMQQREVVPVRASPDAKPTLQLVRRSWIDFTQSYDEGLHRLHDYLSGNKEALLAPELHVLGGLTPLDFGRRIAELTWGFTGREWVLAELDQWLAEPDQRAFIIVGDPGIGKSAIAAWLATTRDEQVAAIHFCDTRDERWVDPHQFVASVVAQLHARMPRYAELVNSLDPARRRSSAKQAFLELVVEPTHKLPAPFSPQVIIVDSLDAAVGVAGESVADVLIEHAAGLPGWLRVMMTTRPEPRVLDRLRTMPRLELDAVRPENEEDVRRYVSARLRGEALARRLSQTGAEASSVAEQVSRVSEGNFLVARLLLSALEQGTMAPDDLTGVSPGLHEFYLRVFRGRFGRLSDWDERYYPLFSILSVALVPLPVQVIAAVLGCAGREARRRLRDIREWLHEREGGFVLFHKSLTDWLQDESLSGDYWCDPAQGHAALADQLWEDYRLQRAGDYGARHLGAYLLAAHRSDTLQSLVAELLREMVSTRDVGSLARMSPTLLAGASSYRDRARAGEDSVRSYLAAGRLYLLADVPYESLAMYCRAVSAATPQGGVGNPLEALDDELRFLRNIPSEDTSPGVKWARDLIQLARHVHHGARDAQRYCNARAIAVHLQPPLIVVSGGSHPQFEAELRGYRDLLLFAFSSFSGTVLSGGTTQGIPGVVGYLASRMREAGRDIHALSYQPSFLPPDVTLDDRYDGVIRTEAASFGPEQCLQSWIDAVASHIAPSQVKLLGIDGGDLTLLDYKVAIALGVRVAMLRGSGRAADALAQDEDWQSITNLLWLPRDEKAVKAFVDE
jgi:hypothetical protein